MELSPLKANNKGENNIYRGWWDAENNDFLKSIEVNGIRNTRCDLLDDNIAYSAKAYLLDNIYIVLVDHVMI